MSTTLVSTSGTHTLEGTPSFSGFAAKRSRSSTLLASAASMPIFSGGRLLGSRKAKDAPVLQSPEQPSTSISPSKSRPPSPLGLSPSITSAPAPPRPLLRTGSASRFRPFRSKTSNTTLSSYAERAGTFSKSSPNLGPRVDLIGTRLKTSEPGPEHKANGETSSPTSAVPQACSTVTPPSTVRLPRSSAPDSSDSEGERTSALSPTPWPRKQARSPRTTYLPQASPPEPHPLTSSPRPSSPQPSEAERLAARALALAKLTDSGSSPPSPAQVPPRPARPPPATPICDSEISDGGGWSGSEMDTSPDSTRVSDYSFRHSPDGQGPSVTFVEHLRDKDWGAPKKVFSERRLAESAIDLLSVVEEDESSMQGETRAHHRLSQPPLPKREMPSPSKRTTRFNSDASPSLWLDGGALPVPKRKRHSSEIGRPLRLSLQRSSSVGSTDRASLQLDSSSVVEMEPELTRPPSRTATATLSIAPTVTLAQGAEASSVAFPTSGPAESHSSSLIGLGFPPIQRNLPRQQYKRSNSEVCIEKPGVGQLGLLGPRSRHESLSIDVEDGAKISRVARTKLVLREHGRPTLTYQLGECIGRGQFGSVYRALNLTSGQVVAVKRIQLEGKSEEEVMQLSNEVSLLKRLTHASVVKYEGVVRTEHYVNIILEYVENGSLLKTLRNFGDLPEALVASYVVKILEGLDYLHQSHVVHCDLKAANILSTKTGNIKLSDFGVSLNLKAVQNLRQDVNDVQGTPNWMAPEVIQLKGASTASDIWSLACTVIELISGKPPYADMNPLSAMFRIVEDDRPPIPARCSPELRDFLVLCFAKEPLKRPTAQELFRHPWLERSWEAFRDMRPQDSIPFVRRISADARRLHDPSAPLDRYSPTVPESAIFPTSPLSSRSPSLPIRAGRQSNSTSSVELSPLDTSDSYASTVSSPQTDVALHPHCFIKTTFSKAVDCKLCQEQTKRHAVLCKDCGLIAHARCTEWAPLPCDLRTQLLGGDRTMARPARATSPDRFAGFAIVIPFSKTRRARPPSLTPASPSISTSSRPLSSGLAGRSFSDLIGTRTRNRSPQPSTLRSASGESSTSAIDSEAVGSAGSSHGRTRSNATLELPQRVPEGSRSAMNLLMGRKSSDFGRRSVDWPVTVQTATGTKLRHKSHARSLSQPMKKKDSTDCNVQ